VICELLIGHERGLSRHSTICHGLALKQPKKEEPQRRCAAALLGIQLRLGGNLTGVTNLNIETGPKRLELLRQMLPAAKNIAVLTNPTSKTLATTFLQLFGQRPALLVCNSTFWKQAPKAILTRRLQTWSSLKWTR
jgi:hypothetical protein